MRTKSVVVVMATLAVIGCGRPADQKAAQQAAEGAKQAAQGAQQAAQGAQQGAQSLAQGLQQMAQGLQQTGPDGKPVPPVDFEKLEALEPNAPSGWEKGPSKGQQTSMGFTISTAEVTYKSGEANVKLTITDAAFNQLIMAPFSMMMAMGYSERSSTGYKKATTVAGNPAWEDWQSDTKHGELGVVVGKRFVVQAQGSTLDSINALHAIVDQIDFGKLAALK